MESHRRSSSRLKDRLARMFRSPSLLRSTCNTSTSATASRCLLNDAAAAARRDYDDSLDLGRSLSFPVRNDLDPFPSIVGRRLRLSFDCSLSQYRPPTTTEKKEEERAPASSCFNKAMEEEEAKEEVKRNRKKKNKKKRLLSNGYGFSSSSSAESNDDGDDAGGFFSSEDEGGGERKEAVETETTFLSSRSFSSDSSEFYQNPKNKNKNKKPHHLPARRSDRPARKHESWGVCRGLRPAVVPLSSSAADRRKAEERRKRGFAVVKRSSDPYNDFRSSMVEMIMERQIFGARDLDNLLRSYLCLNSPHLHLVILQAFSDIWVVLFGH